MQATDHSGPMISWRAALIGGMSGVGVLAALGTANYIGWYWVLLWSGTPSQKIYALLRDQSNVWLLLIGACISVGAAMLAGFVSVRAGAPSKLQALVAGLVCVCFGLLTMLSPGSSLLPGWLLALGAVELITGSLLGGVLAVSSQTSIERKRGMSVSSKFADGLRTIGRGFLLGIGVCFALVVFLVVPGFLIEQQVARHMNPDPAESRMAHAGEVADLELIDVEEKKSGDRDYIVGTIKNNGTAEFHAISVEAELFQAGKFVDKYSTYETSTLAAGGTSHFKIECGCKNSPPPEHDSFKTKIVSAY